MCISCKMLAWGQQLPLNRLLLLLLCPKGWQTLCVVKLRRLLLLLLLLLALLLVHLHWLLLLFSRRSGCCFGEGTASWQTAMRQTFCCCASTECLLHLLRSLLLLGLLQFGFTVLPSQLLLVLQRLAQPLIAMLQLLQLCAPRLLTCSTASSSSSSRFTPSRVSLFAGSAAACCGNNGSGDSRARSGLCSNGSSSSFAFRTAAPSAGHTLGPSSSTGRGHDGSAGPSCGSNRPTAAAVVRCSTCCSSGAADMLPACPAAAPSPSAPASEAYVGCSGA
jgi:hypothetical protein